MSRVGKKIITIPAGVEVKLDGAVVRVKGPKGELAQDIHPKVTVKMEGKEISLGVKNENDVDEKALWGLSNRLIGNMIKGVTEGFQKQLEVNGVGYKVALAGNVLKLDVGFSHEVEFQIPKGITMAVEKNVITISGIDKQQVGEVAAQIRRVRKPEPYKGKGIKYVDEVIRRKAGKAAKAASS